MRIPGEPVPDLTARHPGRARSEYLQPAVPHGWPLAAMAAAAVSASRQRMRPWHGRDPDSVSDLRHDLRHDRGHGPFGEGGALVRFGEFPWHLSVVGGDV